MKTTVKSRPRVLPLIWRAARYGWLLLRWWTLAQSRRLSRTSARHAGIVRQASLVLGGAALGWVLDHFSAGSISKETLSSYLMTTAAMIGGTTAIVFSVTLILLQGATDLYSSKHFDEYVNDWRDLQLGYVLIVGVTILFFAAGLYLASLTSLSATSVRIVVISSLGMVGLAFALIDRQYALVRRKLTPTAVIAFLTGKALRFLRRTEYDAARIAEMRRFRSHVTTSVTKQVSTEEALAAAYIRFLGPSIEDLGRQTELLVDISLRAFERQEIETAKAALTAMGEVLAAYLTARKSSSIAHRSPVAFLVMESDSHPFLSARYEYLNRAGERFLRAGQDDLVTHIVHVYLKLADAAKDVQHLGSTEENPILEQVMWSLNAFVTTGTPTSNVEALFQGAIALTMIAEMAASTGLHVTVSGIQQNLSKIATASLALSTTVVVNEVTAGFLTIVAAAFASTELDRHIVVDRSLQGIVGITVELQTFIAGGFLPNDFAEQDALQKGYTALHDLLNRLLYRYEMLTDKQEKARYRRDFVMLFEALRSSFRRLAEYVAADSLLAGGIGRLIFRINYIILALQANDEFADVRKDLHGALRASVHSPYWFLDATQAFDATAGAVVNLNETVAKTGILAWRTGDKEIVQECIHSIDSMAGKMLERGTGGHGYGEPRTFEKACYLGILALKSEWLAVVADLKARIIVFEKRYAQKYLTDVEIPEGIHPQGEAVVGLLPDRLADEVENFAARFDYERLNGARVLGRAEDLMYDLIEEADIRRFIGEIWG